MLRLEERLSWDVMGVLHSSALSFGWLTGILPAWQTGDLRVCAHHWGYRIVSFYWEQSPFIQIKAGINNWFQYFTSCKPHVPAWERGVAECKQTCERWSSQIRTWDLCLPSLFAITGTKSWLRIIEILFLQIKIKLSSAFNNRESSLHCLPG